MPIHVHMKVCVRTHLPATAPQGASLSLGPTLCNSFYKSYDSLFAGIVSRGRSIHAKLCLLEHRETAALLCSPHLRLHTAPSPLLYCYCRHLWPLGLLRLLRHLLQSILWYRTHAVHAVKFESCYLQAL
jgi:hypothetical protein